MLVPEPAVSALAVDLFNAVVKVGDEVILKERNGSQRRVRTLSRAHLVQGRSARVKLREGVGWVALDRVLIDPKVSDSAEGGA